MDQLELFPPEQFMIELTRDVPIGRGEFILAGTQILASEASSIKYSTDFGEIYIDEAKKV